MKYLAFLLALMIVSCENKPDWATNGETIYSLSGEPLFVVAKADFPKDMTWGEAKQACENLGNGWRLPDKDEWSSIYEQLGKQGKGNFSSRFTYWSSTEYDADNAWCFDFGFGLACNGGNDGSYSGGKNNAFQVRAVRAF